jgi:trimeric autotransporter adhesin
MKTTILPLKNSINRSSRRLTLLLIPFALGCFALLPQARSACQHGCDINNHNTFLGDDALVNNTTGTDNTANGLNALFNNTEGSFNTATGSDALFQNTTGSENTGYGWNALFNNTTGVANTAVGVAALLGMNGGTANAAFGESALGNATTGNDNTAIGAAALINNSDGSNNIALGRGAGQNLTTGDNNIEIGNEGAPAESNTIRIGTSGTQTATFVAGIRGVPINGGTTIGVNANGQLGVKPSSARYKEAIQPMDKVSEAILALKPVIFHYKKELDPDRTPQFGLVAEEVARVNPDLVVTDKQGKPFTVRYDEVNAMLLNEFLKQHKAFLEEQRTVEELEKQVAALTAGLQTVSVQLEVNKSTPQTVLNDQ